MKTNCSCPGKNEEWHYERELGCWYAIRDCEGCEYYWEGPDHSKTNRNVHPTTGKVNLSQDETEHVESLRDQEDEFRIYCYDENGEYGLPVSFDEVQDIFDFCEINKYSHNEIKVITKDDELCILVHNGNYVFPQEWHRYNTA